MAIKVTDSEPDVHVTADELRRYQDEYQKAFMFYAGTPPSLESYIRDKQRRAAAIKNEAKLRDCGMGAFWKY